MSATDWKVELLTVKAFLYLLKLFQILLHRTDKGCVAAI
jgi:hypothetical protein